MIEIDLLRNHYIANPVREYSMRTLVGRGYLRAAVGSGEV